MGGMAKVVSRLRRLAAGLAALALCGCGTYSNYPAGMNREVLGPMDRGGDLHAAQADLASRMEGRDEVLFAAEAGRTAQLYGDYEASRTAFEKAIARTAEQGDQGVVAPSAVGQQTAALLVNDKAIEYYAPEYEQALVHHYQALNYLAARDLDGACVEIRLANRVQEEARKRHEAEIDKASGRSATDAPAATQNALARAYAGLDELAGAVKTSFQNAATFQLSAVVWEMCGERNDAYIDCKKALEMAPDHPGLQAAAFRLGKRLGMREDVEELARRFPKAADTPADGTEAYAGKARLVVMLEEGHVAQKQDFTVPYPVPGGVGSLSIPVYGPVASASSGGIGLDIAGKPAGTLAPLCRISSLAARALSERMPAIVARQIARAFAKGVAVHAADEHGGDVAAMLLSIYNIASEQADLRSWLTLPDTVLSAEAWAAPGEAVPVRLRWGGGGTFEVPVTLAEGKTTLLYVTRANWSFYSHAFVQP